MYYLLNKYNSLWKSEPAYCLTLGDDCCCKSSSTLISSLKLAQKEIKACVYKFDDYDVLKTLLDLLERNVKITLIVDYKQNYESKFMKKLVDNGAKIIYWKSGEKLHAKFTIIDNIHVLTGSFNWTKHDKHVDLIISQFDEHTIFTFQELFKSLLKQNMLHFYRQRSQ